MRQLLFALMVWGFALSIGTGGALAGGGSDSTGEGFHCYAFFEYPDEPYKFSQAMVNEEDPYEAEKKIMEIIEKYVDGEGAALDLLSGNIEGFVEVEIPSDPGRTETCAPFVAGPDADIGRCCDILKEDFNGSDTDFTCADIFNVPVGLACPDLLP